jgi:hypothetical protein
MMNFRWSTPANAEVQEENLFKDCGERKRHRITTVARREAARLAFAPCCGIEATTANKFHL